MPGSVHAAQPHRGAGWCQRLVRDGTALTARDTEAVDTHLTGAELMTYRALIVVAALAALALFAFLNWAVFNAPTVLNLGFAEVNAPLGLIMLIVTGVVSALFLVYIVFQQAGVILETRRYAKELKSHRELADSAEASRFTELRNYLQAELRRIEAQGAAAQRENGARIETIEQGLQGKMAESTRTLSAYLGEIEDKLDRALAQPRA
jgi:uncharacterized integral membrane protein